MNCRNSKLSKNNTSGVNGVYWSKQRKKWYAQITVNYRTKYVGCFENIERAHLAQLQAAAEAWKVIITICSVCKTQLTIKKGRGVYGVFQGLCKECARAEFVKFRNIPIQMEGGG
jgi:uncharacterized CHY-type Zn-finger protein